MPQAILSKSRLARVLDARTTACHAAIEAGHSDAEVGRHLRMTRSGVFTVMKRGEYYWKGMMEAKRYFK